jgi:glucoamylase
MKADGVPRAANDSDIIRFHGDTYSYMWGRDGAFVAAALEQAGYSALCRTFFEFCNKVLSEEGYLFQHYNPDGSLASNWHRGCCTESRSCPSRRTRPR